ncbi:MAG: SRPBCC domain-containing protein, partial [Thermoleophilia bacterium]|nr:SRPBCC domain-containing protein [Thermoleophilia bacterium]
MNQPPASDPQLPTIDSPRGAMKMEYTLDAPRDRVFDAWVTPAQFAGWFGAELEVPVDTVELDAQAGGIWRATMIQGATRVPFAGTFLEVKAPQRLLMTFDDPDN